MKVVFVNDKVQAKDILDNSHNMDVHNFAVNLFCQSGTGRTAVIIFVISNKNHLRRKKKISVVSVPDRPYFFLPTLLFVQRD